MISAKIKRINSYQFNHQADMEMLLDNLLLINKETSLGVSDTIDSVKNNYSSALNSSSLTVCLWVADPTDQQLKQFCEQQFDLTADNGCWPALKTFPSPDVLLTVNVKTGDIQCGNAFLPHPVVQIFLIKRLSSHLDMVAEYLSEKTPSPFINILLSSDDLLEDIYAQEILKQHQGNLRYYPEADWSSFGSLPDAIGSIVGTTDLHSLLLSFGLVRPVRNLGKHIQSLLADRRTRAHLQVQSLLFELEMCRNGSLAKNLRQEASSRVNKMVREQSLFMEQQLDQAFGNTPPLLDEQLLFCNENVGNKTIWQLQREFLSDRLRELATKEDQISRQVLDLHHRFMVSLQQALPDTSSQAAPLHISDLSAGIQSMSMPQSEDYRFEQPRGLLLKVLSGALRPVMTTSMVFSLTGTILGLFSDGLQGISLRTLKMFFSNSVIPQLLGLGLILTIVLILVNNYRAGKKELAHQYANEYRKVLLRLQSDLGRWKEESAKRLKSNYKTSLERIAQQTLAEHDQNIEKQNERNAHQGRERLRTLERQLVTAQDDLKNIIEADQALARHEESLPEYEGLLWKKIKNVA